MVDAGSLKIEINTDPVGMTYGTWATTTDDARIQGIMNDPTRRMLAHVVVPSWLVVTCFDPTEFAALTQLQCAELSAILSGGSVDMANANVRTIATNIFPAGGPTRTALGALWTAQVQKQSRAAELGWAVTTSDITYARTH